MEGVVLETNLEGIKLVGRGKVRDIYDMGDSLLIVVTDRISAFDVILANGIPYKGKVLNGLSEYWFNWSKDIIDNHVITTNVDDYPSELGQYSGMLEGRSMLVKKAEPYPIECVARGYLAGSGWKEYKDSGTVCGISLPLGFVESDELVEPIFTPATKAESGHDINISLDDASDIVGHETITRLMDVTLQIYSRARKEVKKKGIIIADTKFEFGLHDGEIILIDEVLTPDSSRFWPSRMYSPGGPQKSFDKQYVRDYLETLIWDKTPPGPELPENVVLETSRKYLEAYNVITGNSLA